MPTLPSRSSRLWEAAARVAWGTLLVAILVRCAIQPHRNSVYPIFSFAGECWFAGLDCYSDSVREAKAAERGIGNIDQFRYAPIVAAFFAPLALLPEFLGRTLWQLLNFGLFLGGMAWFLHRLYFVQHPECRARQGILWLAMIPLSISSLNNSQANAFAVGLLLIATVAVLEERWNLAAACLAIVTLFKIYPLALGMLFMVLQPRQLIWRTALALAIGLLLPFATQQTDFVVQEYGAWMARLKGDDRTEMPFAEGYQDLHLLLRIVGIQVPRLPFLGVQLAGGAALALFAWRYRNAWPREKLLLALFDLCACWMMLLGPSTEWSTYTLLAPTLSFAIVESLTSDSRREASAMAFAAFGLGVGRMLALVGPGGKYWSYWMPPLAALLLAIERIRTLSLRHGTEGSSAPADPTADRNPRMSLEPSTGSRP